MIKDVVIELVRGRIVFSCPHCLQSDVFSPETVAGISRAITAVTCPQCSYMVSLNKSKIEAAVDTIIGEDPLVKNPLEQEKAEPSAAAPQPAHVGPKEPGAPVAKKPTAPRPDSLLPTTFEKLPADYVMQRVHGQRGTPMPSAVGLTDLILVVDQEDSFRDDIWITFSDIARVEGYRGARGAADYIRKRSGEVTIMMMDMDLGDGNCFEVLDELKGDGSSSSIPTIVTYINRNQYEIAQRGLASYPQVKFCIQKEEFIKKMIELSIKIVRHKG
jgi:CheY-like chemotaxis protein